MKKAIIIVALAVLSLTVALSSCAGPPKAREERTVEQPRLPQPIVKRPEMLDHKNFKWGTQPPEWVTMNVDDLEAMDRFKNDYVFKFESPRSKNLQGAELWTKNFTAAAEIAQQVRNRVQVRFAGAAAGDQNQLETYFEQVVRSVSDATFTGYTQRDSYWVQMRYYKPDGTVDSDDYTFLALFTIPKTTLDEQIRKALNEAEQAVKPKNAEEQTARSRVKEAFDKGL